MKNGNLLKSRVSEIHVKQIRINQGVGVSGLYMKISLIKEDFEVLWIDLFENKEDWACFR